MQKAIIDLGTNTFHLLIADVNGKKMNVLSKLQIPVKLGEGGINQGIITTASYQRGMDAIGLFRKELEKYQITDIQAFGTSAIRDAINGPDFIRDLAKRYQIHVQAISGDREAEWIYNSVTVAMDLPDFPVLVMDIGGGSVEFIIGQKERILWKKSYPLGAARLMERFHKKDPIGIEELTALSIFLNQELYEVEREVCRLQVNTLIGTAGSFETLHDVILHDFKDHVEPVGEKVTQVSFKNYCKFYELMTTASHAERFDLKGMTDFRVDMIVVASVLMNYVIQTFRIKHIWVSQYSLKEGILFSDSTP